MKYFSIFLLAFAAIICLAWIQSTSGSGSEITDDVSIQVVDGNVFEDLKPLPGVPESNSGNIDEPQLGNTSPGGEGGSPMENVSQKPKVESERPVTVNLPSKLDNSSADKNTLSEEAPFPDHAIWDGLTRKYVSSTGKVNYAGMATELPLLDKYLTLLKANPPQLTWPREERMAFWINIYNAYTIKLIAKNYPVSSITKLHDGQPWKVVWVEVGEKKYSLDEVENTIIRPRFNDPRIHFAVNCAAKSCPPLLNKAWTAANLESTLERQTRSFINNNEFNQITANSAKLSKIFDWYKSDFENIYNFLNKYSLTQINLSANISYNSYDWSLNE